MSTCTKQKDDVQPRGVCLHPQFCGRKGGDTRSVNLCVVCYAVSEQVWGCTDVEVYACRCKARCWPLSETVWASKQLDDGSVARLGPLGLYMAV
jgi:hypothetical protein|eukprot:COSAG01_NODE_2104_length_8418_cov_94.839644_1_plen_94_part_00